MDARNIDTDGDLPRVCRHCKWWDTHMTPSGAVTLCANPRQNSHWAYEQVSASDTCDHWEERE